MQQLMESYPFWFAGLSLFGGLLGCSAASAHRLCTTRPAKFMITFLALVVSLTALAGGVTLLGFVLPQAALMLTGLASNDPLKMLITFYSILATWAMGYFSVVAFCVGLLLCTLLQRVGRKRRLQSPSPAA